jgi:multiple sugar transport system ATP-binding protein
MATVALENVGKVYPGGVEAVKGVTLDIPDGSFTVLLGPSGCGKSTLLRMIAGLETITTGTCRIADRIVNDVEPADRDIAMVFQNYALYPHMSVYDNMAYGLRNRRTPKDEIDRRVKDAARILAIGDYLDRKPRALSGGQRQRVALGRAIVRDPKVFLFDEPLSNLDAKLRVATRIELRKLHERLGTTSIYVTHDQVEAMTLGDRVVVMREGTVQQVGPPLELYNKPANTFVAGFIGSPPMNFADVSFTERDGRLVAEADSIQIVVPEPMRRRIGRSTGRTATLGIRPENLRIATPDADRSNAITGVVQVVEHLGAESLVAVDAGGHLLIAKADPTVAFASNETVRLTPDPEALHFFDSTSGAAL